MVDTFTPKDWADKPLKTTPILAADLERIENAVAAHATAINALDDAPAPAAPPWTIANTTGLQGALDALTAAAAAKPNVVIVVTPATDVRPAGSVCIWIGGSVQPTNMGANDLWFAAGPPADVVPPSVPGSLASSAISDTGFTVSWAASTGSPTLYEVFIGGVSYGTTASTSLAVTGRAASTAYSVTVRARDAAGNWSAQSAALAVTTTAPASTPTVSSSQQTTDGLTAAQTLTTASLAAGDTIWIWQATDNSTGNMPAPTSTAGTPVQVGTDAVVDGGVLGVLKLWRCPVGTSGVKTVTIPNASGYDNLGAIVITPGNVTAEGFTKDSATSASAAYTTPASGSLSGSADLAMVAVFVKDDSGPMSVVDSDLTQRANPKCNPFCYLFVGTQVLSASGPSPIYDFTMPTVRKPVSIVVGLKS